MPLLQLGRFAGDELCLPGEAAVAVSALQERHETALPRYMAGEMPPGFESTQE